LYSAGELNASVGETMYATIETVGELSAGLPALLETDAESECVPLEIVNRLPLAAENTAAPEATIAVPKVVEPWSFSVSTWPSSTLVTETVTEAFKTAGSAPAFSVFPSILSGGMSLNGRLESITMELIIGTVMSTVTSAIAL
jgi:hypothetical protein